MERYGPRHDEIAGRITHGGVVIDGIFIDFENLSEMLQSHEGFQFKLSIAELSDDLQ